jgi:hypothetical protein
MISIRSLIRAGLFASLVAGLPLAPATAQEFSESHLAAAKAAAVASPMAQEFNNLLPFLAQRVQNRLVSLRPDLHEVISKTVQDVALRLAARRGDLDSATALIWAREFTEDELNEIAAFYNSPVGKKFVGLGAKLGQQTVQTASNWSNRVGEELLDKAREELKKQGYEL